MNDPSLTGQGGVLEVKCPTQKVNERRREEDGRNNQSSCDDDGGADRKRGEEKQLGRKGFPQLGINE